MLPKYKPGNITWLLHDISIYIDANSRRGADSLLYVFSVKKVFLDKFRYPTISIG